MNSIKDGKSQDNSSVELLQALYKCGRMGSEASLSILKYADGEEMKKDITEALDYYGKISSQSAKSLSGMGVLPKEEDMLVKMGSKMGMTFNTMMDSSSSHLAEMMIQGAGMGITDLQSAVNKCDSKSCSREIMNQAEEGIVYNEKIIESMKKYL